LSVGTGIHRSRFGEGCRDEGQADMEDPQDRHSADELLRRALIDASDSAAVALRVGNLPVSESVTVIFHGRRDLATIQTYVARGRHGAGAAVGASDLMRIPCDLDLADAEDRDDAERLYAEQAAALRDAMVGADTVLEIWREPLEGMSGSGVQVNRSIELGVRLPAHRLLPVALVAPERRLVVTPVCGARTLAEGRPPLGIACAQQDVARIYPLPDDPERCLEDASDHDVRLAERISHDETSVDRFLELNGDADPPPA
jgi:hypothetical protein